MTSELYVFAPALQAAARIEDDVVSALQHARTELEAVGLRSADIGRALQRMRLV